MGKRPVSMSSILEKVMEPSYQKEQFVLHPKKKKQGYL